MNPEKINLSDAHTISGVNQLPLKQKLEIYSRLIPDELIERLQIPSDFRDPRGQDLWFVRADAGSPIAEMKLYHQAGFRDPVLYGQITDTLNGQVHVLLYILNDPDSPRFDVDSHPDGSPTKFGILKRNLEAEQAAMEFGLAPGQIRHGLRMLGSAIAGFESFVASLGHEMYFAEPLFYHNAILFERNGFAYQKGLKLMQRIEAGFSPDGDLTAGLHDSPFRQPSAVGSIRLRSWAIHDNLLGEPYTGVTMYKRIGKSAGINTCPSCEW
jgi:hypothetical protein